jgi:amino acid transporter
MQMMGHDLKREIGVWGLSFNMMNIMIGAGIFMLPAIVAAGLGAASILAYIFCGILISLIMLCFAEVGSHISVDGGVYGYIERTLGHYFGFNAAALLILGSITADAAIANAMVDVIESLMTFKFSRFIRAVFFFLIFSGFAIINIRGVKRGVSLVKITTLAKLIPLILFVFLLSGRINWEYLNIQDIPSLHDIGKVSLILFFAFIGSEAGLSVSGEIRNPQKTVPRGIFLAVSVVLILYMLIQTAALGVLGPSLAEYRDNPLGEAANFVLGPIGLTLMVIGGGVAMLGNLSSDVLSTPRVLYGAAKDRVIPVAILSSIHPKYTTPYVSIIIYAGMDFLFASMGGFESLAIMSTSSSLILYFGMVMAVIMIRVRNRPRPEGSFRIPGGYLVPVISAGIIIWFLSNLSGREVVAIAVAIAALTLIYFIVVRKKN